MKENHKGIDSRNMTDDLSQCRSFLMGMAILAVVMFHVRARSVCPEGALAAFLNDIVGAGHGGCDFFLFLSGFGLAFSLAKDDDLSRYLGRRARKLFPAYYPFILVYIGCVALLRGITWREALGNLTFTGFWFQWNNQFNWYVQTVVVFYLLAPVVYRVLLKLGTGWKGLLALMAFALALQVIFWGEYQMIAVTRVPVFLLGMLIGCRKTKLPWTRGRLALVAAVFLAGAVFWRVTLPYVQWGNGLYWYPFLLLAPSMSFLTAALRPYWLRVRWLRKLDRLVCVCGECSFEIYLVHLLFFETLLVHRQGNLFWLVMAAVFIAAGIGYHYLVAFIVKKLRASREKTGESIHGSI